MKATTRFKPNVEVVSNPEALARKSAEVFVNEAQKAIEAKNVFHVAVSGGRTPEQFFRLLGEMPQAGSLAWDKVELFWVDERIVDADSPWSNYKLAADTFLAKVPIPEENVHRIPTDYGDFRAAARSYEETLRKIFYLEPGKLPEFDLIVLGIGGDGHTGSLFPGSYAAFDVEDLACAVYVLDDDPNRITLTPPVLCAASHIIVLVCGKEKAEILKTILTSEPDEVRYPIHALWPVLNKITWLVDAAAARSLEL